MFLHKFGHVTRIKALSSSNMNSAKALVSSVLPTPVGPRKINEPMGRFGSEMPARERRIVSEIFLTASSWPTILFFNSSSMRTRFDASTSSMLETGIPVQRETTAAISSSVISSFKILRGRSGASSSACSLASRSFSSWNFAVADFGGFRQVGLRFGAFRLRCAKSPALSLFSLFR